MMTDVTRTRLLWLAPASTAVIAVVSAVLLAAIDALFTRAVGEGRVFPFTGEADEQGISPGLVLVWSTLTTLLTLVVVALISGQRRGSQVRRRWPVAVAVVLVLLVAGPVAFLAEEIATDTVSQQLYAAWYVPFLAVGTIAYAVLLLTGVTALVPAGWAAPRSAAPVAAERALADVRRLALDRSGDVRHPLDMYRVLKLRRRPVDVWLAAAMIAALIVLIAVVVSPYFKYAGAYERAGARHLDEVTVDGFEYLGEDASDTMRCPGTGFGAATPATWRRQSDTTVGNFAVTTRAQSPSPGPDSRRRWAG
jgi:hypothetical protein